jgi:hypothetical protein
MLRLVGTPYWAAMRAALSRWPETRAVTLEFWRVLDAAHEVVGDATEADDGVADFAVGRLGRGLADQFRGKLGGEADRAEAGEVAAGQRHCLMLL